MEIEEQLIERLIKRLQQMGLSLSAVNTIVLLLKERIKELRHKPELMAEAVALNYRLLIVDMKEIEILEQGEGAAFLKPYTALFEFNLARLLADND